MVLPAGSLGRADSRTVKFASGFRCVGLPDSTLTGPKNLDAGCLYGPLNFLSSSHPLEKRDLAPLKESIC